VTKVVTAVIVVGRLLLHMFPAASGRVVLLSCPLVLIADGREISPSGEKPFQGR
jgi:hypothetical protein